MLALLLSFHQVVLGSVRQGETWSQAAAVLADATWPCKALRGAELARSCLQGLEGLTGLAGLAASRAQPALDPAVPARPAVLLRFASLSDGQGTRLAPQSFSTTDRSTLSRGLPEPTE